METSTSFATRDVSEDNDDDDYNQSTTTTVDSAVDERSYGEEESDMHITTDTMVLPCLK